MRLQYRAPDSARWRDGGTERIGAGYTALFRIANWDTQRDWEYRLLYPAGVGKTARRAATNGATFTGTIRRDPGHC